MTIAPTALLNPRLAFAAFLLVFFGPIAAQMPREYLLAVGCGALYFFAGAYALRTVRPAPWPTFRVNGTLLAAILAYKLYSFGAALQFQLSIETLVEALLASSIAQKQNVAGSVLVDSVLYLLVLQSLLGLCQRHRPALAVLLLLVYQLLGLQTGRFLLVSQIGLLLLIHLDMQGRRVNVVFVSVLLVAIAASFPLLHAVRSGDIASGADIYSADYISDIMLSDASPGRNFVELATHVDAVGYNFGRYLAYLPLQAIPRAVWPGKPATSLQSDYTEAIYGFDPRDGVTYTFTIFDSYSVLGLLSISVLSLLWGLAFMGLYRAFLRCRTPHLRIQLALLLVNAFNFYRGNVLDFAAPIVLSIVVAWTLDRLRQNECRTLKWRPSTAGAAK